MDGEIHKNDYNNAEEDLSNLLDNALNDFGKNKLNDDDFDEFMATQDKKEVQQAAKDFQQMLEQMATNIDKEVQKNKEEELVNNQASSSDKDAEFMETLNRLY